MSGHVPPPKIGPRQLGSRGQWPMPPSSPRGCGGAERHAGALSGLLPALPLEDHSPVSDWLLVAPPGIRKHQLPIVTIIQCIEARLYLASNLLTAYPVNSLARVLIQYRTAFTSEKSVHESQCNCDGLGQWCSLFCSHKPQEWLGASL